MKMMFTKMAAIMGGMGIAGYMYLKKHPEKKDQMMHSMKKTCKEASKKMYNMLDEE